jgi:hypothetical protein
MFVKAYIMLNEEDSIFENVVAPSSCMDYLNLRGRMTLKFHRFLNEFVFFRVN